MNRSWIEHDSMMRETHVIEIDTLREEIKQLKSELLVSPSSSPVAASNNVANQLFDGVRLCIVAPEVTLVLSDYYGGGGGVDVGDADSMYARYRSEIPMKKIERFIEKSILPKFTNIFEVGKDSTGMDGTTELSTWVKLQGRTMQRLLESQLKSVFKTTAAASSTMQAGRRRSHIMATSA